MATDQTQLIIFDYILREGRAVTLEQGLPTTVSVQQLLSLLESTGWTVKDVVDVDAEYECWYSALVQKIHNKEKQITEQFGSDWFDYVVETYTNLLTAIRQGSLGGAIVTAYPQSISRP